MGTQKIMAEWRNEWRREQQANCYQVNNNAKKIGPLRLRLFLSQPGSSFQPSNNPFDTTGVSFLNSTRCLKGRLKFSEHPLKACYVSGPFMYNVLCKTSNNPVIFISPIFRRKSLGSKKLNALLTKRGRIESQTWSHWKFSAYFTPSLPRSPNTTIQCLPYNRTYFSSIYGTPFSQLNILKQGYIL